MWWASQSNAGPWPAAVRMALSVAESVTWPCDSMSTVTPLPSAYPVSSRRAPATRSTSAVFGSSGRYLSPKTRTYGARSFEASSMKRRASSSCFARSTGSRWCNSADDPRHAIRRFRARRSATVDARLELNSGRFVRSISPSSPRSSIAAYPSRAATSRIVRKGHAGHPRVEKPIGSLAGSGPRARTIAGATATAPSDWTNRASGESGHGSTFKLRPQARARRRR